MSPREHALAVRRREILLRLVRIVCSGLLGWALLAGRGVNAAPPAPILETLFPAGGQAGKVIDVTIAGKNLAGLRALRCNAPGVQSEILEGNRARLALPADVPPGLYDVWAVSDTGISAPRTVFIGNRPELTESEPNETQPAASPVPLNVVVNGRIE